MTKNNEQIKKVRVTFPIDDDINEMLNEAAVLMDTSKAQLIRDVLRDVIPETHSMLKNAQRLVEEGREAEVMPRTIGSSLHKLATFFDNLLEEDKTKK